MFGIVLFKFPWMVYGKFLCGNLIKFYFRVIVIVIEDGSRFVARGSWRGCEEDCFSVQVKISVGEEICSQEDFCSSGEKEPGGLLTFEGPGF